MNNRSSKQGQLFPDEVSTEISYTITDQTPEGWVLTTMKEICEKPQYGWTTSADMKASGVRLLRTTDISSGEVDWSTVPGCREKPDNLEKYLLSQGDIVVSRAGSVGISYLFEGGPPTIFASYLIRLRPYSGLDSKFLALFLNTPMYWSSIAEETSGIAIPNVNASKLQELNIPLPPLAEQKKIVEQAEQLLEQAKATRESLKSAKLIIERFRQAVLDAACSGRLTEAWRAENPDVESAEGSLKRVTKQRSARYESELERANVEGERKPHKPNNLEPKEVESNDLPIIPESWKWIYLPDLGYMSRGKSTHRPRNAPQLYGGPYPFIQTGDIAQSNGRIASHQQTYSEAGLEQSRLWPEGTVCITIAANIANSAVLTYPACFPDSIVGVVTDRDLCLPEFLEFYIRTVRKSLDQFAPATAQKNINVSILNEVAIAIPPILEQKKVVEESEKLFELAESLEVRVELSLKRAEKMSQSILAKAFRGELVPTEAELAEQENRDYEHAVELLKRIQAEQVALAEERKQRRQKVAKDSSKAKTAEVQRTMLEILSESKSGMTPEELFSKAGFTPERIEDFYQELRGFVKDNQIVERRPNDSDVYLEAASI